jgi:murein DD-endopeptidase MepM/ murein hydrolase activator NlpD
MSRLRVQKAVAVWLEEMRERLLAACDHFRESRLYVQTICAVVLVGSAWLVHLVPSGPLGTIDAAMAWAVRTDYDFGGKARQAGDWASSRGGWGPALAWLWQQGVDQVRDWVGPVGPFAPRQGAVTGAADPAQAARARPDQAAAPPGAGASEGAGVSLPSVPQTPLLPVAGSVLAGFGWPQSTSEEFHEGIDFYVNVGAPVVAIRDGTVQAIRHDEQLGTLVEVRHDEYIAVYGQVEAVTVRAGDRVSQGQQIAAVARSRGAEQSLPPHLHFEIRPVSTGKPVDPAFYLGLGGKEL